MDPRNFRGMGAWRAWMSAATVLRPALTGAVERVVLMVGNDKYEHMPD